MSKYSSPLSVFCQFFEQLDLEHQGCVRWDDASGPPLAVSQVGRDEQLSLAAGFHARDALVPALDHFARCPRGTRTDIAAIPPELSNFFPLASLSQSQPV